MDKSSSFLISITLSTKTSQFLSPQTRTKAYQGFKAKYNKVKAKLVLLSSRASASKAVTIKNKGLIAEAYEWEKEVSSDDNEMVEVKVLMPLVKENDAISKEGARNGEWVKISMRKRILGVDQLTEDPFSFGKKYLVIKSSADDTKVSIPGVERPWLFEDEGFILPNHDTGRILLAESQRNITDPLVDVTDSSATDYDSADESSVCNAPLPLLKKLDGVEPISGKKTIKLILRSKSTFKAKTLNGVIINEPFSAPAKGNKSSSALKDNSAPAGKLKSVKIKDDPPLAIVIKGLNDIKLQISKNRSSYSRNNKQCDIRKPIWYLDSGCSRHMTGVKSCLHKYEEQPGPNVVFGHDSTCDTEGYGLIKIALVAIIDCQLPFEYTIASRSTDVMVMVLRVEKKLFLIEQPISPALLADSKYFRSEMRFMMLIMKLLVLPLEEEGKPVGPYVIKMKNYVAQLKLLGYVLPRDLSVGLNWMASLVTLMVLIQKSNKKSLNAKGKSKGKGKGKDKSYIPKPKNPKPSAKEHPAQDDTCHHCKEVGHSKRNCPAYLAELIKKEKQVVVVLIFVTQNMVLEDLHLQTRQSERRNRTLLDMVRSMMNLTTLSLSFWDYALEIATHILNMVPTKKADKTPYELWYVEFFEKNLLSQKVSGGARDLKEIQDEDASPFKITSEIPMEVESFKPPHEEKAPVRRSIRTHRASKRLCINVEVEEHSLGDLNEPANY
nr:zinc finger, CCHC-type [Tanacetum cinerariifolium]